ncbi:MAG: hypothetical protein FWC27_14365 [Firmicutes bacterium]|nr:hypothetical protein [Bacillota bacterium]
MPISTEQLQQLKRTNISRSPEKTKQRVTELWQGLKIKQKQAVRELADITAQPVYRTQETGTVSARLTLAFAQALNVNPFYLTGEADEPGECTDLLIRDLLLRCGYQKLVASMELPPAKRKYTRHPRPETEETTTEELPADDAEEDSAEETVPQLPPGSGALTGEDLQQLVIALYVQAKAGITSAKEKLDQIKLVIFS